MAADPTYKMIVIDLDGTLLLPSGEVSPRTKAAVHAALDAGLLVCFATGRNWTESRAVLDDVAHYPTAVFAGGAMVMDTGQEVTLHRTLMGPALAGEVCGVLESMGHAVLALQDLGAAGIDYLVTDDVTLNDATRLWMTATQNVLHHVPRLRDYNHEHTIRVGIVAAPDEVQTAIAALREKFGERVLCQNLMVPTYGVEVLEVFDPAVNKWEGIKHLARRHAVRPEQIVAVGDDINDLPMIRSAGLGVAMGNAREEVQAAAGRIIGRNTDDGLAIFLEELIAAHAVVPAED